MFDDNDDSDSSMVDSLTYTDILLQIDQLKSEIVNLDDDSLVDEVSALQYNLDGMELKKIHGISLKHFANVDLTDKDREFLRNVYITYYSSYALLVDDKDESDENIN